MHYKPRSLVDSPRGITGQGVRTQRRMIFRPLRIEDLPLLHEWLNRPHVAEWWGHPLSLDEVERDYIPSISGSIHHHCYIALDGGRKIGFIQSYDPTGWHHEGWWLDENDPTVKGIDQFIASSEELGRGLGTRMVREFVAQLLEDPTVSRVQTDPAPTNSRAIRCYEKAGFRAAREVETPDGTALLMYCDRESLESSGRSYQPTP